MGSAQDQCARHPRAAGFDDHADRGDPHRTPGRRISAATSKPAWRRCAAIRRLGGNACSPRDHGRMDRRGGPGRHAGRRMGTALGLSRPQPAGTARQRRRPAEVAGGAVRHRPAGAGGAARPRRRRSANASRSPGATTSAPSARCSPRCGCSRRRARCMCWPACARARRRLGCPRSSPSTASRPRCTCCRSAPALFGETLLAKAHALGADHAGDGRLHPQSLARAGPGRRHPPHAGACRSAGADAPLTEGRGRWRR